MTKKGDNGKKEEMDSEKSQNPYSSIKKGKRSLLVSS